MIVSSQDKQTADYKVKKLKIQADDRLRHALSKNQIFRKIMTNFICNKKIAWILIPAIAIWITPAHTLELIMFETKGCIWCKKWHNDIGSIYSRTEEGKIAPLRLIEMNEGFQEQLNLNVPITVSPTFVLVAGKNEVGRIIGYPGEEFFWFLLSELLEKYKSFSLAPK